MCGVVTFGLQRDAKLDTRLHDGVFLGIKEDTDELIIGTNDGVFISRTMRRKPWDTRWSATAITSVSGTPCKTLQPHKRRHLENEPACTITWNRDNADTFHYHLS